MFCSLLESCLPCITVSQTDNVILVHYDVLSQSNVCAAMDANKYMQNKLTEACKEKKNAVKHICTGLTFQLETLKE